MQSKKLVAAVGAVGLLALVAAVAAVQGQEVILALALVALLAATAASGVAALFTQRRIGRQVAYIMRKGTPQRDGDEAPRAREVEKSDILGLVRLMQAQYLGRLDRAQDSLESAAEQLANASRAQPPQGRYQYEGGAVLSISRAGEHYAEAVNEAIRAGIPVVVDAGDDSTVAWIEQHGWSERVVMLPGEPGAHPDSPLGGPSRGNAPATS